MNNLPEKRDSDPEVIEPDIVGLEPPPQPLWRRLVARAAFAVILAVIGAALALLGVILTLTILGAFVGIPLIIVGVLVCFGALLLPLTSGRIKVVSFRQPPR